MNENPHIHDLSPIVFSELFEVSIIGTAQDWEDFSYKYPHVFTLFCRLTNQQFV